MGAQVRPAQLGWKDSLSVPEAELSPSAWARVSLKMSEIGMFTSETCKGDTFS